MTVILWIGFILTIISLLMIKFGDDNKGTVGVRFLFVGIAICAIGYFLSDSSEDESGYNVSFQGSETSRKRGKPCHHITYGAGSTRECSDKGNCSGFSSKNRDPYYCINCEHHVDDHY